MNKRLVGGMILLNLCAISLPINDGEVDITNEDVKSQLVELRNFIDEKRDFTKGAKDLKPVLVQYRSSDSKIDGVVQCNMGFNTDALHLSIGGTAVLHDGEKLTININVEYQYTDYVGYTIKTAKLNVVSGELLIYDTEFRVDISSLKIGDKIKVRTETEEFGIYVAYGEIVDTQNEQIKIVFTPLGVETIEDENATMKLVYACYIDEESFEVEDIFDIRVSLSATTIDIYKI